MALLTQFQRRCCQQIKKYSVDDVMTASGKAMKPHRQAFQSDRMGAAEWSVSGRAEQPTVRSTVAPKLLRIPILNLFPQ